MFNNSFAERQPENFSSETTLSLYIGILMLEHMMMINSNF